jgi:hypothetical protein
MKTHGHFQQDGITAVLSNTVLNDVRQLTFFERFPLDTAVPRIETWQRLFIMIAAFTERVDGIDWQPPELSADADALTASFEALIGKVHSQTYVEWSNAITALIRGVAGSEDQGSGDETEDFLAPALTT